jgi:uncharacterized membrane protein
VPTDPATLRAYTGVVAVIAYTTAIMFYLFVNDTLKTFSFGYWAGIVAAILTAPIIIGIAATV